jgi:sugar/nucleoside kinase (ribokinase family)
MEDFVDIVILGHLAKDIIEIDGIDKESLGGVVYYGGIAGSKMNLKLFIITRLKKEDFPILDVFTKNNIRFLAYPSEETSGLKNIYFSKNLELRQYLPLGFAGIFNKEEIPDINTKYFVIGGISAGEINIELLEYIYKKYTDKVCLDIQGFIRVRENNSVFYKDLPKEEKQHILSMVKVLKVDQTESLILTREKDIVKASKTLVQLGPEEILITHEKGITLNALNEIYFFPWKNKNIHGRTGRGDTAFISYIGSRISKTPSESLKFSAALTSLKLETPGPFSQPLLDVYNLIKKEY